MNTTATGTQLFYERFFSERRYHCCRDARSISGALERKNIGCYYFRPASSLKKCVWNRDTIASRILAVLWASSLDQWQTIFAGTSICEAMGTYDCFRDTLVCSDHWCSRLVIGRESGLLLKMPFSRPDTILASALKARLWDSEYQYFKDTVNAGNSAFWGTEYSFCRDRSAVSLKGIRFLRG